MPSNPGSGSSSSNRRERRVPIDTNHCVVHGARVVGCELDAANEPPDGVRNGDDEVAKYVFVLRLQDIRQRHLDNQIWNAESPFLRPYGNRRPVRRIAFRRSRPHPLVNRLDLLGPQEPGLQEVAVVRLGQPRRHSSAGGRVGNALHMGLHIAILEHAERGGLAWSMTAAAMLKQKRGDLSVERDDRFTAVMRVWRSAGSDSNEEHYGGACRA